MSEKIFAAKNWQRLLQQERLLKMDPEKFLALVAPDVGEVWVDLGCGPGFFTIPLAQRLKLVYATDISKEMLAICQQRAEEESLQNINYLQSDSRKISIESAKVDGLFLANVYHEFEVPAPVLAEMKRLLKPAGRVFNIDWRYQQMEMGPPLDHRVPESQVVQDFEAAGFSFIGAHDIYQQNYVLEFRKPK